MVDPFDSDSVLNGKHLNSRRFMFTVYLPLMIFGFLALAAFVISVVAINRAQTHPDCACRKIMSTEASSQVKQAFVAVVDENHRLAPPD